MSTPHPVVVGAGVAALALVDALRAEGHDGPITVVGDEPHLPYDRPPLSKQVLAGTWEPERVTLRGAETLGERGVELRREVRVTGVDPVDRRVHLDDGSSLDYDRLAVATGVRARRLPFGHDLAGVHVLRDLDEARALRAALTEREAPRVVVVGAGFLGCEIAASARGLGATVDLVEPLELPLRSVLGDDVGAMVADLHREHGVRLHLGRGVAGFDDRDGRVRAVELDDGTRLEADVVVVAVGSTPALDWLDGSGLPVGGPSAVEGAGGLLADERGRVAEGVWALGDVAAWWSPAEQAPVRIEHRLVGGDQAQVVARDMLGADPGEVGAAAYFWTDQYDLKLQSFGLPRGTDEVRVIDGALADRRFVALFGREGRLAAVVGAGRAKVVRTWREAVAAGRPWDDALAAADEPAGT